MRRLYKCLFLAAGTALLAMAWPAGALAVGEYDLEFSILSEGGGASASASYAMVDSVKMSGVEETAQASASYSVESLLADVEPPAAVTYWYMF